MKPHRKAWVRFCNLHFVDAKLGQETCVTPPSQGRRLSLNQVCQIPKWRREVLWKWKRNSGREEGRQPQENSGTLEAPPAELEWEDTRGPRTRGRRGSSPRPGAPAGGLGRLRTSFGARRFLRRAKLVGKNDRAPPPL